MTDQSDYNLPRTKMHKLLPEPLDSDVNTAVFENLFNRFLTKNETSKTAGYVGVGNPNALTSRQIKEPTVARQANQLQPVLHNKIGSVDHMASWGDILNELERLGVEIDKLPEWGQSQVFNWVPPIDVDKAVNYSDYYWVDNTNSSPEYITIKNRCRVLTDRLALWQRLIDTNGDLFSLVGINTAPTNSPGTYNRVIISGNYTHVFEKGFVFFMKNISGHNTDLKNKYHTAVSSSYNTSANQTTITIETFFDQMSAIGTISLQEELTARTTAVDDQCTEPKGPTGKEPVVVGANQWIVANKWQHRTTVANFSAAKQAQLPIIEYDDNLELNEWTCANHEWKYRTSPGGQFVVSSSEPSLVELKPLAYTGGGTTTLILGESSGDQTSTFVPNSIFENQAAEILEVVSSRYELIGGTAPYRTIIEVATAPSVSGDIVPLVTSNDDPWFGYGQQWLYSKQLKSVAMPHPTPNPFLDTPLSSSGQDTSTDSTGTRNYQWQGSPYAMNFTILAGGTSGVTDVRLFKTIVHANFESPQNDRALMGADATRVYIDGIRQFGNYEERDEATAYPTGTETRYVTGIRLYTGLPAGSVVRVEVGAASISDIGYEHLVVRTEENDIAYGASPAAGSTEVSLIKCRKVEQVKTDTNQYPMFDVFNTDGTSAQIANALFEFDTDPSEIADNNIGLRVVTDDTRTVFTFNQLLLGDDGETLAYKSYDNSDADYWVNTKTQEVYFWNGFGWSLDGVQGFRYGPAVSSPSKPTGNYNQRLWYNTATGVLMYLNGPTFVPIEGAPVQATVEYSTSNPHLQTIWRKGTNDELYIPRKVDWKGRTEAEYNTERDEFVASYTPTSQALSAWYSSQFNELSLDGLWIGDWDIPAPLYYNNQHENRATLTTTELNEHFTTIKSSQPKAPGIPGSGSSQFHSIPSEQVNYALGGTIREYGAGFDTLLSSAFVNNVTPITLFEFARDQYEILLNSLRENFRDELFDLMVSVDSSTVVSFSETLSNLVLTQFTQNDAYSFVYGDSTTFIDNNGTNDIGIQNWIATLPFFQILPKVKPVYLMDDAIGINEIVHHDGHRRSYNLTETTKDNFARRMTQVVDNRSVLSAPNNKLGRQSTLQPPTTVAAFATTFGESINNRRGVYWYQATATTRTLYRLAVAAAGTVQPPATMPDGSLWVDTTGAGTLRVKTGTTWPVASGLVANDGKLHNGTSLADATVSAWTVFDIDEYLANLIFAAETKLHDAAPNVFQPVFDFNTLQSTPADIARYNQLQELAFLDYVRQGEITAPLENVDYVATNPFTWNYKHSAPGQSYDIISASTIMNTITIAGEHAANFVGTVPVYVKNTGLNDGSFTVTSATNTGTQTILQIPMSETVVDSLAGLLYTAVLPKVVPGNTGGESAGDWRSLYQQLYGTPYPHLEPWKLQGYSEKPSWWDFNYKSTDPTRRWTTNMWNQIQLGTIPTNQLLPDGITVSPGPSNGQVTQYEYFSVNTNDVALKNAGVGYDELLPPYYAGGSGVNRTIFTNIGEIQSPAASYAFGDLGPVETDWRLSSQYLYDQLDVAYQMQPLKTMDAVFGFDTNIIADLAFDTRTGQVPTHNRTKFHGEVLSDGSVMSVSGINQWYVNYNRYQGFDASLADFRRLWTGWTAPLTYQFSTFVDTGSFQLGHRAVPISEFDYNILSKRSPGVEDFWLNAFEVTVLHVPPKLNRLNNQHNWKFELDINSPVTQAIEYYNVRNYQFAADATTDVCELYSYKISALDYFNTTIQVGTNQLEVFVSGRTVEIKDSAGNDGTYTIRSAAYDKTIDATIVSLNETLLSPISGGTVVVNYRTIPWETGDPIFFTTEDVLPTPLISDQPTIGPIVYFIIKISDTTFKVANTKQNAFAGLPIELSSGGFGVHRVGQIRSTFYALDRARTSSYWRHYEVDTDNKLTLTPPTTIHSMQQLINIIDGYSQVIDEAGFKINEKNNITDPETGRVVDWQIELERFIDFAYSLQARKDVNIGNRFEATVDDTTDSWTWGQYPGGFATGSPVHVLSSNGRLPIPILHGVRYYLIADSTTEFRLAHTRLDAFNGNAIDIASVPADATLMVYAAPNAREQYPSQEINPFRNAIFFNPPRGIVSNMITGPAEDIRNTQLIFDQYGEPLTRNNVRIYRQDHQTFLQCADEVHNPHLPSLIFDNPYNYLHFGGAHVFIDAYEHVLVFNNETTEGALLYDPFIGLNVTKFEMLFNRQVEFTQRPNVGGSYYSTHFNQGASLLDNFEASVENIRYLYDVYNAIESKSLTVQSRTSLGYEGTQEYLADLNLNQKSQFIFWRGLIQNKGAVESVQAFINSRRFIDANVDEFWAYKLANFGSSADKEYPELYITTEDVRSNDFRIQFTETAECIPGYGNSGFASPGCGFDETGESLDLAVDDGITLISLADDDRWFDQPDILSKLKDNGSALYFNLRPVNSVDISGITDVLYRHDFATDYETITMETVVNSPNTVVITPPMSKTEVTLSDGYIPFTGHISVFKNGAAMTNPIDYEETASPGQASFFSTKIAFTSPLEVGDEIVVVWKTATLTPNVHFDRVNSNIIRIRDAALLGHNSTLWGFRVDEKAQNPARLVDRFSSTIVSDVPLWDPARDIHYKLADAEISLRRPTDPAIYTETLNNSQGLSGKHLTPWNNNEVGHVWLDTAKLGYVPYYDSQIFVTLEERLKYWGQLADWSVVKIYEWVESNVHPEEYNELADEEEGDGEIAEHLRKSGRAKETIFELVNGVWEPVDDKHQEFSVLLESQPVVGSPTSRTFTLDANILGIDTSPTADTQYVSVYVNGIARISPAGLGFEIPTSLVMEVDDTTSASSVRFIKYKPHENLIEAGIEDGTMARQYEHTVVPYIDKFGQEKQRYYFWVEDKVTRSLKQKMSPSIAEQQLATIPTPYIVTGNPEPADTRAESLVDLTKSWKYLIDGSNSYSTGVTYQIPNQTHHDFDGVGGNGTFTGGAGDLLSAYAVGDIITMQNLMRVYVDAINAFNGNVTEFTVLNNVTLPIGTGNPLGQHPNIAVVDDSGTAVPIKAGFSLTIQANNKNDKAHDIALGSAIKDGGVTSSLIAGQNELDYISAFLGGDGESGSTTEYVVGNVITLDNNATVLVNDIHDNANVAYIPAGQVGGPGPGSGLPPNTFDVTEFTVLSAGDPFTPGTDLLELYSTPLATNSGFTLFPVRAVAGTQLTAGETQADYTNRFIGGENAPGLGSTYNQNDTIVMDNGATINVDTITGNGDVATFTVVTAGTPAPPGVAIVEAFTSPPSATANSGFTILPEGNIVSSINTSLLEVTLDGRTLIPNAEYKIDATGRVITVHQSVGPTAGKTIGVTYTTVVPERLYEIPERQTDIVIRGLRRYVNEDRRYTVRFTRDFTLRDDIDVSLKSKHTEWTLIRKDQATKIPLTLWNRLTEAMAGYKLTDVDEAVPELTRKLYDAKHLTDTQYGLGDGQAFTNGAQAIDTIVAELFNEDIQLNNVDLNAFFNLYNFETPENVVIAMDTIYSTFTTADVNRLFFVALHDAFANKQRFAELFKTSMIAVYGIRPFQVSGLFDD